MITDNSAIVGRVSCLAFGVLFALSTCAAQQPPISNTEKFEFGVIGDQQYTPETEAQFPFIMAELDRTNLVFVVHVGDFRTGAPDGGAISCADATFAKRKATFDASAHPFIFTPGDNEWTDCSCCSKPLFDPLERLEKLRELFFPEGESLGKTRISLTRQSTYAAYKKFVENAYWVHNEILFATIHVVGSNNNLGRTPDADAEYRERNAADLVWLRNVFGIAKQRNLRAAVILTQANPKFEDVWSRNLRNRVGLPPNPARESTSGYAELLEVLRVESVAFSKPVLFIHGDTHYFQVNQPMVDAEGRMVENFTRLEVFGSPNSHWVRVLVDPEDAEPFSFRTQIVKENLLPH